MGVWVYYTRIGMPCQENNRGFITFSVKNKAALIIAAYILFYCIFANLSTAFVNFSMV